MHRGWEGGKHNGPQEIKAFSSSKAVNKERGVITEAARTGPEWNFQMRKLSLKSPPASFLPQISFCSLPKMPFSNRCFISSVSNLPPPKKITSFFSFFIWFIILPRPFQLTGPYSKRGERERSRYIFNSLMFSGRWWRVVVTSYYYATATTTTQYWRERRGIWHPLLKEKMGRGFWVRIAPRWTDALGTDPEKKNWERDS